MTEARDASLWHSYPMGPTIRRVLGIDDESYRGESAQPSAEEQAAFGAFVAEALLAAPPTSLGEFVDVCEELTAMGLPSVVLGLAAANPHWDVADDFRGLLAIGSAAMMEGELEDAERLLLAAHALATEEPAPYVNLAGICYAQERDDEALEWATAGLRVDPDNRRLWEVAYSVLVIRDPSQAKERVKDLAEEVNSFAGLSIAADLIAPQDALLKAQYLERLYHQGNRKGAFLVEYTAALGLAGDFKKIPAILWEASRVATETLPWQLYAHAVQAHLAMEETAQADELIKTVERLPGIPAHVIADLKTVHEQNQPAP